MLQTGFSQLPQREQHKAQDQERELTQEAEALALGHTEVHAFDCRLGRRPKPAWRAQPSIRDNACRKRCAQDTQTQGNPTSDWRSTRRTWVEHAQAVHANHVAFALLYHKTTRMRIECAVHSCAAN